MKPRFSFSTSNIIFFVVVAIGSVVVFFASFDGAALPPEAISYRVGYIVGQVLMSLLLCTLFAWIVWRLSRRSKRAASVTFNVFLTLIVLSQIGQVQRRRERENDVNEMLTQRDRFKEQAAASDDPEEFDAAYAEYTDSVKSTFEKLAETGSEQEKQVYTIMRDYVDDMQSVVGRWNDSFNAVLAPEILDVSRLTSDEEFARQKRVVATYIKETKAYSLMFDNLIADLTRRLGELGSDNETAQGVLEGARGKYLAQRRVFKPLMKAHLGFGEAMLHILELLQENKDDWAYVDGELELYTEPLIDDYNALVDALTENQAAIDTLAAKMVDLL